jgi:hypothetical protein
VLPTLSGPRGRENPGVRSAGVPQISWWLVSENSARRKAARHRDDGAVVRSLVFREMPFHGGNSFNLFVGKVKHSARPLLFTRQTKKEKPDRSGV